MYMKRQKYKQIKKLHQLIINIQKSPVIEDWLATEKATTYKKYLEKKNNTKYTWLGFKSLLQKKYPHLF